MRKNDPKDLTPLMALALIKIQKKQFDKAQDYLNQYAKTAESTPGADPGQAYIYLAQLSLEQKNEAAASQWLDKIPPTSQQYLPAQITRAQLLAKQGKTRRSAPVARESAELRSARHRVARPHRRRAAVRSEALSGSRSESGEGRRPRSPTIPISPTTTRWPPKRTAITT